MFSSQGEFKRVMKDLLLLNNEKEFDDTIRDLMVEKAFIEMDENQDGGISLQEFQEACINRREFSTMLTLKIIEVFVE